MNLLLFFFMLAASFIIIRIGALAFHLTGLDWAVSKFQALSCFTGTGFTTRESELIIDHPQRRSIASTLMITGNLGLVTLIATFANSIRAAPLSGAGVVPFIRNAVPAAWMPFVNLLLIVLISFVIARMYFNRKVLDWLTGFLRKHILRRLYATKLRFIRLLTFTGDRGVVRMELGGDCGSPGRTIGSLGESIRVLVLEREGTQVFNPSPEEVLAENDMLVCFGNFEEMKNTVLGSGT